MSSLTEVTDQTQFERLVSSTPANTLLILSFYAPWAAPCAQMNTVLATLAASYPLTTPPKTTWLSIIAEELPDASEAYDVTAVPFLVLIRNKKVLQTLSGSDASKVRVAIEEHAKASEMDGEQYTIGSMVDVQSKRIDDVKPDWEGTEPPKDPNDSMNGGADAAPDSAPVDPEKQKEELHKRLSELVVAAPVMLFMKGTPSAPQCGFSRQLVALLRENGVKYGFFNILADDEVRQGLKEFADWPTFPQLWVGGELVGGLDIVKEEVANDPDFFKDYAVKTNGT